EGEIGVVRRGDGEAGEVPAVDIDGGVAGARREGGGGGGEGRAGRDGADHDGGEGVGIAGKAVDGGAEIERDRCAFESARRDRGDGRGQRIDGDGLGRGGGGAEIALGIPCGGGDA